VVCVGQERRGAGNKATCPYNGANFRYRVPTLVTAIHLWGGRTDQKAEVGNAA
jgi:hypothetical protein